MVKPARLSVSSSSSSMSGTSSAGTSDGSYASSRTSSLRGISQGGARYSTHGPSSAGVQGKGKGKKGKKGEKVSKEKKEDVVAQAMASAKIWEMRLEATEKSRMEFRENAKFLLLENDKLQTSMEQTEKDTIDVISFLRKEDQTKDEQITKLQHQVKEMKREGRKDKEKLIEEFSAQINGLEERLGEKDSEVKLMQSELKLVKEFRRKRAQMQKDLDEIKDQLFMANKEHKHNLSKMEHKFFEEKIKLQQEASQKIAELAERAHTEAIEKLDETTRSVYKENVRLNEALSYHMKEASELRKERDRLLEENKALAGEKELNDLVVNEKVVQHREQKVQLKELQQKVESLERSLSHVVQEFETERGAIFTQTMVETESSRVEIAKLQRVLDMKDREMRKVKKLARNILDQRTEVERFFLDSLEYVKQEIAANRAQYLRDARMVYQKKMMAAHAGHGDFPRVRTFNKMDGSTNTVYSDLEEAERWTGVGGKVDLADLTWEQKEKVLRMLFAKMNGTREANRRPPAVPPIRTKTQPTLSITQKGERPGPPVDDLGDSTFLTTASVGEDGQLSLPPVDPAGAALSTSAVQDTTAQPEAAVVS
ncbi:basal body-orientation factor 1-like isoform X2 [Branchiostoma floridae x Branchiostoma japonicum]